MAMRTCPAYDMMIYRTGSMQESISRQVATHVAQDRHIRDKKVSFDN